MKERIKLFYSTATQEDLDTVDNVEEMIMQLIPAYSRQTAASIALQKFLLKNPDKYALPKTGGNYKKHKTLKRKHRKFTNKSKKHKRTIYHRKK
jgi:hypothetical protein